jgi:hypothetical protein
VVDEVLEQERVASGMSNETAKRMKDASLNAERLGGEEETVL